jgi:hypothetical protein
LLSLTAKPLVDHIKQQVMAAASKLFLIISI